MGPYLSSPNKEKHPEDGNWNGVSFISFIHLSFVFVLSNFWMQRSLLSQLKIEFCIL
jgi:hypothetical protein